MSETKKKTHIETTVIKAQSKPVTKADESTHITDEHTSMFMTPTIPLKCLKEMVDHSTILPQCIRAYKDNIAGFGIGVTYREDIEETEEMIAEYNRAEELIELLNLDMDTKEVFEDVIEARETYGVSYIEVLRNLANEVNQIEFIRDVPSIKKTSPLDPAVEIEYFYQGEPITRQKKFCKYKQEKSGKIVYFKEFSDPRIMDKRTGEYVEALELKFQANEILEFTIGTADYGTVRWIGQALNVDGSRRAENLNNNYFMNGRHTPLMVIVKGGSLSEASFTKLQTYMNDIKGEAGQHAFMVLEVEDSEKVTDFESDRQPSVEIKDMAAILQKDELFQDYLNNSRKKVQSAFRLPDLYTGYTTDFNRATAQVAQEITEKQVFIPERKSLAWTINNKLLNAYRFKFVEVYFKEPDITNPDDIAKILNITERAGGVTPNIAKEITLQALGKTSESYPEEWGEIPLALNKSQQSGATTVVEQIDKAIEKAVNAKEDDIILVMKEVKKLLLNMSSEKVE